MLRPQTTVSITKQVLDFMIIDVTNANINSAFCYTIIDKNNHIIRKGNFKGQMVQLRLSHIPEDVYQFSLYQNDELIATIPFEKKSAAFDKTQLFGR